MAKVYEALRRAEEERKRKLAGDDATVTAVEWDSTPQTLPKSKSAPFWKRWRGSMSEAPIDTATDMNKRRITILQPDSFIAEQFRTLRGRIDSISAQRPIRTVAVTSANAGDGKSTAAINLSLVTAMSVGRETLLVDCDFRRPKIHKTLGLDPKAGLAEVLTDRASLDDALVKVEGLNLQVLCIRSKPSNPSELLASAQMRALIEEISRRYDRAILDTPEALGMPDAKTVSELCDGLVLVVRADYTPREEVEAVLDVLDRRRVLGLLLNGADQSRERYGYY
ncbi:MAG: CpsD/CapB family tyrosine-protein kinase [Proteobacteria bacterium]|nr:CpsD/CapB family tyrosine-protein kinase [Pseudomonadota bacterium]